MADSFGRKDQVSDECNKLLRGSKEVSSAPNTFRQALRDAGVLISDEKHLADIIVGVIPRSEDSQKWNLDVIAEVLSQDCSNIQNKTINWKLVVECLDQPNLTVRSMDEFQLLARFFLRITGGVIFPASGLVGTWNNKAAQFSMLVLAANCKPEMVMFYDMVSSDLKRIREAPYPPNLSYMCLPLYDALLELAGRGMQAQVLKTLYAASDIYPEYVTILLAQAKDSGTNVRGEVLTRNLQKFTGLSGSRPTSEAVMRILNTVNPGLLVWLFRLSLKRAMTTKEVVQVNQLMASMGEHMPKRVEDEGSADELINLWCVRADRSDFNLEAKVRSVLEAQPLFAKPLAIHLRMHGPSLRPKAAEGSILSVESFNIILGSLSRLSQATNSSAVSAEDVRELSIFSRRYQADGQGTPTTLSRMRPEQISNIAAGQQAEQSADVSGGAPAFDDIERDANAYFQKIYSNEISLENAIQLLKRFKTSSDLREQDVFRSMIHNFFDEYRFFHRYRDKELMITGRLFGMLIQHQLVSSITLGIALRYVLEAVRKDPQSGVASDKMFRLFGKTALEQFRSRLNEWPQYCSHLLQLQHFARHCPELYQETQLALNNVNPSAAPAQPDIGMGATSGPYTQGGGGVTVPSLAGLSLTGGPSNSELPPMPLSEAQAQMDAAPLLLSKGAEGMGKMPRSMELRLEQPPLIELLAGVNLEPAENPVAPADNLRDQIYFIINNVAQSNYEAKSLQLRKLLTPEYYSWFASYLVSKRISTQPNHHALYLSVLDILDSHALTKALLRSTYFHVTSLLQSPNITTSSSERSLLRNLGMWLGQVTLARNKPIIQRNLHLKELLFWGFETGKLIAVCSFVAKIVEGVRDSVIFRPPNPWLMALLGVLRDLYETEDLKMNIKFEVQVLCKSVNIRIDDIPKANLIGHCRVPNKDGRNPDFNVKVAAAAAPNQKSASPLIPNFPSKDPDAKGDGPSELPIIPNITPYVVINPSLQLFANDPSQRRLVVLAVDKAIREIIPGVVDRSSHISSITTKQIVLKDFASEPNENQLRTAAHAMVSNVAGTLALAHSKDLLRGAISKNLRSLIAHLTNDQAVVDQVVQVCANENVDLGCALVKKLCMERATRDIDEQLTGAYQARRKAREAGQPFVDSAFQDETASKYLKMLPESLKMQARGASANQMSIYDEFHRLRVAVAQGAQSSTGGNETSPEQSPQQQQQQNMQPAGSALSMQQALDAYKVVLRMLEDALNKVNTQMQGREVTMSMLGGDHEILSLLREMITVTQRTQPNARTDTAMVFAENVFKRLMESPNTTSALRLDVMVGCLEALRDACGGPKKFVLDVSTWLGRYSTFNVNDEQSRRVHRAVLTRLLRMKLLRSQEADAYFASCMDSGRNMLWVELALSFVRQCLADGLAATYEFTSIFDIVSKMRPTNAAVRKQLQKWLTDLRSLAASQDQKGNNMQQSSGQPPASNATTAVGGGGPTEVPPPPVAAVAARNNDAPVREHVTVLLERWLRVWSSNNDQVFTQYLQLMHQYGVLKTENAADRFFRIATELCVEACLKSAQVQPVPNTGENSAPRAALIFTVIDALSKLFMQLVRLADKENGAAQLLSRILTAVVRTLIDDHDSKKTSKAVFDQRPYFRLLFNLAQDLGVADPQKELNPKDLAILSAYSNIYSLLVPPLVPGFAFGWLQLVSHRCFMPHLLLVKGQKGWPHMHRLLISLLLFLKPYLKSAQMNEAIRKLYKGTLRVLLVLLHDFPEFLSDYHVSFCDAIPASCVQLRNLILSAFPRSMRPTDPFTSNLKIDSVPEMNVPPRLLADYANALGTHIRPRLDSYLATKQPAEFPTLLPQVLVANGEHNVTLISVLTLYIGDKGSELQNRTMLQGTPAMEIFKHFMLVLDAEGRYHVLNAMANQLRFPNTHTHYFSSLMLTLFVEADNEYLKEQITRVLLERLIVHRPHPWGLLVTFIELIKNPRFSFWQCAFTKCATEIEKVFESVARSCIGPADAAKATSAASA